MFAFLEELMDHIDPHLGSLYKAHEIVCFYKMDMKPDYKIIKSKLDKAIKVIRTAREEDKLQFWPETSRLIAQEVLLLKKEITGNDYKISDEVIKIHNKVEKLILADI